MLNKSDFYYNLEVKILFLRINDLMKNPNFSKYFKNTSWLFLEKVFRLVIGVFIGIWIARYLGPESFGLFSYAISFVGIFIAVATLGLDGIIVKELVKGDVDRDVLIGTAFGLRLIGSFFVILLLSISIQFTSNDFQLNIYIFIIASSTIFQSFNVIDYYFQSQVISKYAVYSNMISMAISSCIKVFLIINEADLIAFIYLVLFDSFILSLGLIYFYIKNKMQIFAWSFDLHIALSLLKNSWFLILSGIVSSVYMQIDQVMIQNMLGSSAVGQYAAAVKLSEIWYLFPAVISASLFPAIINAKNISDEKYYSYFQKLYDGLVWFAIFISVAMTFAGDWLITFLYGLEYQTAGTVLKIHVWSSIFIFIGVASSKWFIIENLLKYSFYKALSGSILNVVLNYYMIPVYGIIGSAVATLLSLILADYFFNLFSSKTRITFILQTNSFLLPLRFLGLKISINR